MKIKTLIRWMTVTFMIGAVTLCWKQPRIVEAYEDDEYDYDYDDYYDDYDYEDDYSYDDCGWYMISSDYAPGIAVRSEPSKKSDLLCRIPYGTEFYVEAFSGTWGYTTVDGETGWIDTDYAEWIGDDVDDEETDYWDDYDDYEEAGEWYYIVSRYKPGIAVRSEPTKDSELLCRIPYGTWFYVEALCDNWGYTTVNGVTGWIDTDYAEVDWDDDSVVFEDKGLYKDGSEISSDSYILPDSDGTYLSRKDLANLTLKGLCYVKNEIYARHGRKFKAKELQNYFNWQEWYDGIYEPSDATDKKIVKMLNKYEKQNVDLLVTVEKEKGTYSVK